MLKGRILKGVGGFYDVQCSEDGGMYRCKARGHLRNDSLTPLVGDMVSFTIEDGGAIEGILPRKNELVRPAVANIDQLVIVVSACVPKPDWLLMDKLLLSASVSHIAPLLVLNKMDSYSGDILDSFQGDYAGFFPSVTVSSYTGTGLAEFRGMLAGRISCFSGQSAVGKSSLLNALFPGLSLETGSLSKKTERGKHTTRHAELIPLKDGAVLDTPGFSLYDPETLDQNALNQAYPEFGDAPLRCRFTECAHITEPDCAVKDLLSRGSLSKGRYERYKLLHEEFDQRRKHRYD